MRIEHAEEQPVAGRTRGIGWLLLRLLRLRARVARIRSALLVVAAEEVGPIALLARLLRRLRVERTGCRFRQRVWPAAEGAASGLASEAGTGAAAGGSERGAAAAGSLRRRCRRMLYGGRADILGGSLRETAKTKAEAARKICNFIELFPRRPRR